MTLLYTLTFTQLNEHCDWLILGHVPLIKFKLISDTKSTIGNSSLMAPCLHVTV